MLTTAVSEIVIEKPYDKFELPGSDCSQNEQKVYRKKYDSNGNAVYVEEGVENISQNINSYKNVCSLEAILSRISLLPLNDKVAYLRQSEGVSANTIGLPKDGTEAFIQLKKVAIDNPEVFKRLASGESFESVVRSLLSSESESKPSEEVISKKDGDING